jgi:hypothetical protein
MHKQCIVLIGKTHPLAVTAVAVAVEEGIVGAVHVETCTAGAVARARHPITLSCGNEGAKPSVTA